MEIWRGIGCAAIIIAAILAFFAFFILCEWVGNGFQNFLTRGKKASFLLYGWVGTALHNFFTRVKKFLRK